MDSSNVSPLIKATLELLGNSSGSNDNGITSTAMKEGVEIAQVSKLDSSGLINRAQNIDSNDAKVKLRKSSKDKNDFES